MSVVGKMMGYGRDEHYDKAIRLYDQGNYQEAIESFTHVLTNGQDAVVMRLAKFYTAEAYSQLGQRSLKHAEYDNAVDDFLKALDLQPNYPDLHYYLAIASRKQGDYESASAHLNEALTVNPRYAKAVLEQGVLAYRQGEHDSGLKRVQQALSLDPQLRVDRYDQAVKYHQQGQNDIALMTIESIAETESDAVLHARLADDLYRKGMYPQAVEEYEKALSFAPRYADIRCHYGLALSAMGHAREAIAQFEQALEINPKYVEARLHLAVTYRDCDQPTAAEAEFRKVLELDPENIIARNNVR